jgi:hypothetical protein
VRVGIGHGVADNLVGARGAQVSRQGLVARIVFVGARAGKGSGNAKESNNLVGKQILERDGIVDGKVGAFRRAVVPRTSLLQGHGRRQHVRADGNRAHVLGTSARNDATADESMRVALAAAIIWIDCGVGQASSKTVERQWESSVLPVPTGQGSFFFSIGIFFATRQRDV